MARVTQLAKLFQSLASNDRGAALRYAEEIIEDHLEQGHHSAAQLLQGSLISNRQAMQSMTSLDLSRQSESKLIVEETGPELTDVMLRKSERKTIEQLVLEYRNQDALRLEGIRRRSKVLLSGPPGCGKTLTARALGAELNLPVMTARLSAIIGSYLGQTGANLRALFQFAQSTPCVLLLDEFDSLGRCRGRADDIGELDRVVVSLLQELDHSTASGFIVAATNLEDTLDRALWRRFDVSLTLPKPTKAELRRFGRRRLVGAGMKASKTTLSRLEGLGTYAEVDRALEDLRRQRVLKRATSGRR